MPQTPKSFLILFLAALFCAQAQTSHAGALRTRSGELDYPDSMMERQPHDEFLPYTSYQEPLRQQWDGQAWDPSAWNKPQWTPQIALKNFFDAGIFTGQYDQDAKVQVIELGPVFYTLSDLDRRRTLKLLTDTSGTFTQGHEMVLLRDWSTHDNIGFYVPRGGMFLQ